MYNLDVYYTYADMPGTIFFLYKSGNYNVEFIQCTYSSIVYTIAHS